jgi:hypothetical protein
LLSGFFVNAFGFAVMLIIYASLCVAVAPLMFFLKSPAIREEAKEEIIDENKSADIPD